MTRTLSGREFFYIVWLVMASLLMVVAYVLSHPSKAARDYWAKLERERLDGAPPPSS